MRRLATTRKAMVNPLIIERYGRRFIEKEQAMEEEQKPLFGDLDLVINTLETEASEIGKQIEKGRESIDRKEAEIAGLEERLANIRSSLAEIRKQAKAKEEKADVPF